MLKAARVVAGIRGALRSLNPAEVRDLARQPFLIQLHALSPRTYEGMENFFLPRKDTSDARFATTVSLVRRAESVPNPLDRNVIRIYERGMPHTAGEGFEFDPVNPDKVVCEVIERHPDLKLALARQISPFREQVSKDIIWQVSRENALFSLATAVPSIMPLISLPWAVGEFASDTAFLTANQIRMAFMLAAANDRTIGYSEQRAEIASLFAGAFGWRAIARELVGKIPMGGGLIPKAAIAFGGTYVIGASLERYYRVGYGYTGAERKQAYEDAVNRGKTLAASMLEGLRAKAKPS